jgi:hypothetical protein
MHDSWATEVVQNLGLCKTLLMWPRIPGTARIKINLAKEGRKRKYKQS